MREYSLSILFATILVFCLLKWESVDSRSGHPIGLYATLFLAPLIQYGLIFLALGIFVTIGLRLLLACDTRFRFSHLVIGSVFLGTGGLLSFVLTLHYQFQVHTKNVWYLAAYYFDPKTMNLWSFLSNNTYGLLSFSMPGRAITLCVVVAASVFCISQIRSRKYDPLTLLVFSSLLLTACAGVARSCSSIRWGAPVFVFDSCANPVCRSTCSTVSCDGLEDLGRRWQFRVWAPQFSCQGSGTC